ncbi:MAG: hypothetical protein OHK0029_26350 [Armatimonadaceae bacterium]
MDEAQFQQVAKALSDAHRLHILEMLKENERMHCGAVVDRLSLAQATVSHHLKELVNAGLLQVERDGQFNHYTLNTDTLDTYTAELRRRFL